MEQKSLGLIETIGLTAAIEAADIAVKSANVELVGYELTKGSGMTVVKVQGTVGAVKAAIESAKIAAGKVGKVVSVKVIARPSKEIDMLIDNKMTVGAKSQDSSDMTNSDKIDKNSKDDFKNKSEAKTSTSKTNRTKKKRTNLNTKQNKSEKLETSEKTQKLETKQTKPNKLETTKKDLEKLETKQTKPERLETSKKDLEKLETKQSELEQSEISKENLEPDKKDND